MWWLIAGAVAGGLWWLASQSSDTEEKALQREREREWQRAYEERERMREERVIASDSPEGRERRIAAQKGQPGNSGPTISPGRPLEPPETDPNWRREQD